MKVQACDGHIKTPYGHGSPLPLWYASCPVLRNRWRGRSVFPLLLTRIIYCIGDLCARISLGIRLPGPQHSSGSRGVVLGFYCFLLSHKFKGTVMVRIRRCRRPLLVIWGRGFRDAIPIAIQSALYVADQVIPSPELR